jgi:2-dehydro-3-deoxy-D-arabinonate dehydratase
LNAKCRNGFSLLALLASLEEESPRRSTMQLCKAQLATGEVGVGIVQHEHVHLLDEANPWRIATLSDILHSPDLNAIATELPHHCKRTALVGDLTLLAPVDQQEVWAAGVTYKRSQEARERESVGAARFYDLVYSSARPELFFKATAGRVVGPGDPVHIRRDSKWSVPEPELALVISPEMKLVGYTIGNDMSARDIEGENPLYLPQAKVYDASCALGPCITLVSALPSLDQVRIHLSIERGGKTVFEGSTALSSMARTFEDLISWLGRECRFPHGVVLLTGTGIVPPDDFSLNAGDQVAIEVTGIGRLVNPVRQREN